MPKCGGDTHEGHLDLNTGGDFVAVWKSGRLKAGWTGLHDEGHLKLNLWTFRCAGCRYIELYGFPQAVWVHVSLHGPSEVDAVRPSVSTS